MARRAEVLTGALAKIRDLTIIWRRDTADDKLREVNQIAQSALNEYFRDPEKEEKSDTIPLKSN